MTEFFLPEAILRNAGGFATLSGAGSAHGAAQECRPPREEDR